jgi:hypothetical protein
MRVDVILDLDQHYLLEGEEENNSLSISLLLSEGVRKK